MFWLHSTFSHHPLRFSNRPDLLVPRTSTAMAQSRSFVSIGPSLWNAPSSVRSAIISVRLLLPSLFSKPVYSCGALHIGSTSQWLTPLEVLYKCLYTIQYKTRMEQAEALSEMVLSSCITNTINKKAHLYTVHIS